MSPHLPTFQSSRPFSSTADQIDNKEFASLSGNDSLMVCKESHNDLRQFVIVLDSFSTSTTTTTQTSSHYGKLPIIYFVTPTYPRLVTTGATRDSFFIVDKTFCRREQIAELTRLGQTLMHVQRLVWIVADDTESCNPLIDNLLSRMGK